jgi:uncharacterized protein (TIGR02444 family)
MSEWSAAGGPSPARNSAVSEDESRFWTFSLTVYGDPVVQKECLDLQDECGTDVNMLLFCAFVGAVYGAVLSDQAMKEACEFVGAWRHEVVIRLREARRALNAFATTSPIASPAARLRTGVKALELEAEHIEQTLLEFGIPPRRVAAGVAGKRDRRQHPDPVFNFSGEPSATGLPSHWLPQH